MQQLTTKAEICLLLDQVLETALRLRDVLTTYVWDRPPEPALLPEPEPPPPQPVAEPEPMRRIAPVLTISLADLNRERVRSLQRRQTRPSQPQPRPKPKPKRHHRDFREVEVVYRKGFKLVS